MTPRTSLRVAAGVLLAGFLVVGLLPVKVFSPSSGAAIDQGENISCGSVFSPSDGEATDEDYEAKIDNVDMVGQCEEARSRRAPFVWGIVAFALFAGLLSFVAAGGRDG